MNWLALAYLGLTAVMSLLLFCCYGFDKWAARRDRRRISERTLHRLALLGGWPGAWVGQRVFRHKTQKRGFQLIFWAVVLLHLALIGTFLVFLVRGWWMSEAIS